MLTFQKSASGIPHTQYFNIFFLSIKTTFLNNIQFKKLDKSVYGLEFS